VWATRLADLGVRVAADLVDMGEFNAASRHLATLVTPPSAKNADDDAATTAAAITIRKALLYLRIGDTAAAERSISVLPTSSTHVETTKATLTALSQLANGNYPAATTSLSALHDQHPDNELVSTNLAVCLLYSGHADRALDLLSALANHRPSPFPGLLFNLATMYELRGERAGERKLALAESVAEMGPSERGWERTGADFKL